MNEKSQLHALVHGQVQGVYFRDFTRSHAVRLGLTGWVRNLPDGYTVEVLAQGETQALEKLLTVLHRGPPEARVNGVDVEWQEQGQRYETFRVS